MCRAICQGREVSTTPWYSPRPVSGMQEGSIQPNGGSTGPGDRHMTAVLRELAVVALSSLVAVEEGVRKWCSRMAVISTTVAASAKRMRMGVLAVRCGDDTKDFPPSVGCASLEVRS